jgi:hypothetical protein
MTPDFAHSRFYRRVQHDARQRAADWINFRPVVPEVSPCDHFLTVLTAGCALGCSFGFVCSQLSCYDG